MTSCLRSVFPARMPEAAPPPPTPPPCSQEIGLGSTLRLLAATKGWFLLFCLRPGVWQRLWWGLWAKPTGTPSS